NQWSCNGSPTQSWRWRAQPGGGWSLVNANSGKCLSIRGQGDGALAVQQPCDGSPLQTWN
ncbi:RICIN domain-containing protein, partial [Streptomyces sp. NPDC089915]